MAKVVLLNQSCASLLNLSQRELADLSNGKGRDLQGRRCEITVLLHNLSKLRNHFHDSWRKQMLAAYLAQFEQFFIENGCEIGIS